MTDEQEQILEDMRRLAATLNDVKPVQQRYVLSESQVVKVLDGAQTLAIYFDKINHLEKDLKLTRQSLDLSLKTNAALRAQLNKKERT